MKIAVDQLQEGTVLASDVIGVNGQILLKSGNTITEKNIRAFKMWGILEVEIPGEEASQTPQFSPEILEKADQHLQNRFHGADLSHPVLNRIYEICLHKVATKISNGVLS